MLYLYKKTTSTGTTIGITEATSERNLAERVLAAIPKDETIIALSGDALPDGLITLPALMDAVQELMAKEDNAHAADPNHIIEIAGETGMRLTPPSKDDDEADEEDQAWQKEHVAGNRLTPNQSSAHGGLRPFSQN